MCRCNVFIQMIDSKLPSMFLRRVIVFPHATLLKSRLSSITYVCVCSPLVPFVVQILSSHCVHICHLFVFVLLFTNIFFF